MARRAVEEYVEYEDSTLVRMRVDLHGCSTFGPNEGEHSVIRWEWIDEISSDGDGVVITAQGDERDAIFFPAGLFGLSADELADRLQVARSSIVDRGDILDELGKDQPLED